MTIDLGKQLIKLNTPAFLYIPSFHQRQINLMLEEIKTQKINCKIYYSIKTNDSPFVLKQNASYLDGFEAISLRELKLARTLSKIKRILINGPCKTEAFLNEAINAKAYIYIDNEDEYYRLEKILKEKKQSIEVGLRMQYGTSEEDKRFGISTSSLFYKHLITQKNELISISGLHSHVSSYAESTTQFSQRMIGMKKSLEEFEQHDSIINTINIGGGFDPLARLSTTQNWKSNEDFSSKCHLIKQVFSQDFFQKKTLLIEPGRALSEAAIIGVGEIITIKTTKQKKYVFIDFSTAFAGGNHPAEACIQFMLLKRKTGTLFPLNQTENSNTILCGSLCSGNDVFGSISKAHFTVGDRIILLNAGAYSLSFRWHGPEILPPVTYYHENKNAKTK